MLHLVNYLSLATVSCGPTIPSLCVHVSIVVLAVYSLLSASMSKNLMSYLVCAQDFKKKERELKNKEDELRKKELVTLRNF